MNYWNALDHPVPGVSLDHKNMSGHNAPGAWLPSGNAWPGFAADTGHNSAGNGGDGQAYGGIVHATFVWCASAVELAPATATLTGA